MCPQISNEVIKENLIFTCQIILWKIIIKKTLIFARQIVLWMKVIKKSLIFAGQNLLWKKVIRKTLIFVCQIVFWKKLIKKTLIFAGQNVLWKKVIKKLWFLPVKSKMSYYFIQSQFHLKFEEKKYIISLEENTISFNNNFLTWLLSTC